MRTVIVSPHPDDEWVGCGCTLLSRLDQNEEVLVLLVTTAPHSEKRIVTAKNLAKQHGYNIFSLGEPELNISEQNLVNFLRDHVRFDDVVLIPSFDSHPDHRKISRICKKTLKNKMYEYASYNNSFNPVRRLMNKFNYSKYKHIPASFMFGKEDLKFTHKLDLKNEHIRMFGEFPRGPDIVRRVK